MSKKKKEFEPLRMATSIIKDLHVHRLSAGRNTQLITYDSQSGLYAVGDLPIEEYAQLQWLLEDMDDPIKDNHVQEVIKAVRRNAPLIEPHQLNDPQHRIIVFQNGVLDLSTLTLRQHSPESKYTMGIPHKFNPDAKCPHFDRFINEILPTDAHQLIRQLMGYLLIPSTAFRKFFVFVGEGANGKSTLIVVIVIMLGRQNVSHQSLHAIAQDRFSRAELFGKLANPYADLESQDVRNTGILKQIVAGDPLQYEKKFKDPFSGPATARLLFSANEMPVIHDTSEAMTDRLILIDFPRRFEESEQDKELIHKLTTEAEVEGIIARFALPGLIGLLKSEQFAIPETSRRLQQQYRHQCDPFSEFVRDNVQVASAEFVTKSDLYSGYRRWCEVQGIPKTLSLTEFNRRIRRMFNLPKHQDRRAPGTRDRAWPGIKLGDPVDPTTIPGKSRLRGAHLLGNPRNPRKEELLEKDERLDGVEVGGKGRG